MYGELQKGSDGGMNDIDMRHGDCLELMKNIPNGSVDLVLTDPPYGTMKGAALDGWKNQTTEWDTAIDPVKIFEQISRVLRQNGKAVLFSAASGVGKSTQAALWQKHRDAEIINGDKAGILVENGVYACGVPFCGTSGICQNRIMPLGAIVLLSQGKANSVKRLSGLEALQGVLKNVHLDLLAPDEQRRIFDLLINLLSFVPVYFFECTASEEAVDALETALCNGGVIDGT
jgi:hypothetical protein